MVQSVIARGINVIKIMRETIEILLEATPKDLDSAAIVTAIQSLEGIHSVDDMHIWVIRSGYNALSCHIVIDRSDVVQSRSIVESVKALLRDRFHIEHSTSEVEFEECQIHG